MKETTKTKKMSAADRQDRPSTSKQGFEFQRTMYLRGYVVVQRSGLEIKERLHTRFYDVMTL